MSLKEDISHHKVGSFTVKARLFVCLFVCHGFVSSEGPVNYKTKVYASEEIKQMMFFRVTKRGACYVLITFFPELTMDG